jgi:hypothetical protein
MKEALLRLFYKAPEYLEIAATGTTNPTSSLYNSMMLLMALLLAIALLSNAFMRPVHARHHLTDAQ